MEAEGDRRRASTLHTTRRRFLRFQLHSGPEVRGYTYGVETDSPSSLARGLRNSSDWKMWPTRSSTPAMRKWSYTCALDGQGERRSSRASSRGRLHAPTAGSSWIEHFLDHAKPSKPPGFRSRRCRRRTWRSCAGGSTPSTGGDLEGDTRRPRARLRVPPLGSLHGHAAGLSRSSGLRGLLAARSGPLGEDHGRVSSGSRSLTIACSPWAPSTEGEAERRRGQRRGRLASHVRDGLIVRLCSFDHLEGSPRSRRAFGVGDVAGERGGGETR